MPQRSRRKFLITSAAVAATAALKRVAPGVVLAGPRARPSFSEPRINFPVEPRDRLAVASWPFRAMIESPSNRWARDSKQPGMDLKDFAAPFDGGGLPRRVPHGRGEGGRARH